MTTKYFCDRCDKELNPLSFKEMLKSTFESVIINQKQHTICIKCYKDFKKWYNKK